MQAVSQQQSVSVSKKSIDNMQHYKIKLDLKEMCLDFVGLIQLAWDSVHVGFL